MSSYYIHKKPQSIEVYETTDFTLINTISLEDSSYKYIWFQEEILVLQNQKIIVIDPIEGILDEIVLDHHIQDITEFNDHVWGCYDGGVIEIKIGTSSKAKAIKYNGEFIQIVSADVIYLRTQEKLFKMVKRTISEVSTISGSIQGVGKELAIIKPEQVTIGTQIFDIPDVERVVKFEDYGFITPEKIIYGQEYQGCIDIIQSSQIKLVRDSGEGLEAEVLPNRSLRTLLASNSKSEVVEYCNGIIEDDKIKSHIMSLSSADQVKLYEVIIPKISKNTLTSETLSLWLKWLLIINRQGVNSVKSNKVKSLNSNLAKSIDLMGSLLSLKGRLNLIRLQGDMKVKSLVQDHEFDNDDDSVFIANGEDD